MNNNKRVVITGMGSVSSHGHSMEKLWNQICNSYAESPIYSKTKDMGFDSKKAYEIENNFDVKANLDNSSLRRKEQFSQILCVAGQDAMEDADLKIGSEGLAEQRIGAIVTTVHGPMIATFKYLDELIVGGPKKASPLLFQQTVNNVALGQLSMINKLKGVSSSLVGCSSINYAINLIKEEKADVVLACGMEELHPHIFAGYSKNKLMAVDKGTGEISLPLSDEANGIILGEGASVIVLESYESAKHRNVNIYAEIVEYASVTDEEFNKYFNEFKLEKSTGIFRAMDKAIKKSNIENNDIDFVSVAANSHKCVDKVEEKALKSLFKERYEELGLVSSKAIFGETFGCSETNALICALLCMVKNSVPGLKYLPSNEHKINNNKVKYGLVNSFFIGGSINSVLLKNAR